MIKVLILKRSLVLSKTNTLSKSDPKKEYGSLPYEAKMFFLQSRQMKVSGYTGA